MRSLIFKLAGAALVSASFVAGWILLDYRDFLRTPLEVGPSGATFTVEPGTSVAKLARELKRRGAIGNARYLVWLARLEGDAANIKAGEYEIEPNTRPEALLTMLVSGRVKLHSLTVVEGWTFHQMLTEIERSNALKHTLKGLTDAQIMERLGKPGEHPEGRFYPDTYRFPRGTTDAAFLRRAYDTMARRLAQEWQDRADDLPLKSPYEALILASIVERETAVPEERERIAGVFIRRLERGMRLQTDPTVIYGLGPKFDGNLRLKDLRHDTPYNTYTRAGLPPTPIALPGGASIHAALHPAPGKALYFVARGDGTHQFSDTLAEHNRAVIKYQLGGKRRSFSSDPEAKANAH